MNLGSDFSDTVILFAANLLVLKVTEVQLQFDGDMNISLSACVPWCLHVCVEVCSSVSLYLVLYVCVCVCARS